MKFLHLSDLHIGKSVNGFSMLNEQRHVFRQITGYIRSQKPAAVIIAGDVYDRSVPGVEAVGVFDDFLTELADADVAVMLISGNHDSPERLNYASRLLSNKKIYLCGMFEGRLRSVVLTDKYGEVHFWLLPFIKPSSVHEENYGDAFTSVLKTAGIDYAKRNVLISHQFFAGAGIVPIRSESEINPVGGLDVIDAGLIQNFDYAALGHLHGAQTAGAEHIRYAGSPVKYSFSEWRQKKSVNLVELNQKGNLSVTALPLVPLHEMREIRGELEKLMSDEVSSLADKEDYVRVILTDEEEIIDPMGKIRSVYPNVMALDFENSRTSVDISGINPDLIQTEQLSPYDLFSEFFLDINGSVMSDEQAKIARELLETGGGQ